MTLTCEIAVMNREAIALAADSAATITGTKKIFPSAEKLFSLSKQPVGIMVYGNADMSEVPWETIIKRFKNHLGDKVFNKLDEYGSFFIKFLEQNKNELIPESAQERYMQSTIEDCFNSIVIDIDFDIKRGFENNKLINIGM